ncbi:hypothetical protein ACP70R_009666 [Stipagrostis hirtigluma subsp. patula]
MEADRLSALPDELLHNVLSFLPAPEVVQSSVLSRRWRHLWRSTPCVDIDSRDFQFCPGRPVVGTEEAWERFARFADNLLLLHDAAAPLDRLRVRVPVLRHRQGDPGLVRRIDVGAPYSGTSPPPPRLQRPDPAAVNCRRLRALRLHGVALDEGFLEGLRAGCPALEDLALARCACALGKIACGERLRRLAIERCHRPGGGGGGLTIVGGPRLAYLRLELEPRWYQGGVHVSEADAIARVSIVLVEGSGSEAKADLAAILRRESEKFHTFHNLRTLWIGNFDMKVQENIQALGRILRKAPGLEKLTLHHRYRQIFSPYGLKDGLARWTKGSQQSQDPLSCEKLTSIEIKYEGEKVHCPPLLNKDIVIETWAQYYCEVNRQGFSARLHFFQLLGRLLSYSKGAKADEAKTSGFSGFQSREADGEAGLRSLAKRGLTRHYCKEG